MRRSTFLSLLLLLAASFAPVALASDWPQWRGPFGNGSSPDTGLPSEWSEQTLSWSAPLAGLGVSSPVVAGDLVFVTSQAGGGTRRPGQHPLLAREDPEVAKVERALADPDGKDAAIEFVVEAFDRERGERKWQRRFAARGELPLVHEKHNLATPSPVTDGEAVFAWFGNGQLVALDANTGKTIWERHLGEEIGPFVIDWGHGSSPALGGDRLYLLCFHDQRSLLLAVDKRTGTTRFTVERDPEVRSYSTPILIEGSAGAELVVNSTEGLHGYHPDTGELLWHADGEHRFGIPVPTRHGDVLYASRGYRSGPVLALRIGGRGGSPRPSPSGATPPARPTSHRCSTMTG